MIARLVASLTFTSAVAIAVAACSDGGTPAPASTIEATARADAQRDDADLPTSDAAAEDAADTATSTLDASQDASNDAAIDARTDAAQDAGVDSGPVQPPSVSYIGRWDESIAGVARGSYPALRAVARFRGTSAQATITAIAGDSYFDVLVDGGPAVRLVVPAGVTRQVTVAQGLALGEHTVELYRRNEAFTGATELTDWTFPGGALLAPAARPQRRIEFVGNSTMTGYGVEGVRGTPSCNGNIDATHNARLSLVGLLPAAVAAEGYTASLSGTGVLYNESPNDLLTIEQTYLRTMPFSAPAWNFGRWQPNVVLIMVGGTDVGNPAVDPPPTQAAFAQKYAAFMQLVRTKNPQALIVGITSPTTSDDYPDRDQNGVSYRARTKMIAGIAAAVAARRAVGDANVDAFTFPQSNDVTACDYHPSPALYQAMTTQLGTYLRAKLGW
jgi:lysophospholipase L1-like esterase